jgi:thiamine-phosphate pyrophosphorylase
MSKVDLTLYLVTNSDGLSEEEFLNKTEEALKAGVTLLQLREKEREGRDFFELACKVNKIAKRYGVPLLIDDRLDIAMAADTAGVHLGRNDLPVREARKILGPDPIIGATAKTVEQALDAQEQGADYVGVGAIYPTTTKVKTILTSVDTLKDICRTVQIPAVAIGGLNSKNLDILRGAGMDGIAVVTAIMQAQDTGGAVRELLQAVRKIKQPVE